MFTYQPGCSPGPFSPFSALGHGQWLPLAAGEHEPEVRVERFRSSMMEYLEADLDIDGRTEVRLRAQPWSGRYRRG